MTSFSCVGGDSEVNGLRYLIMHGGGGGGGGGGLYSSLLRCVVLIGGNIKCLQVC